MENFIVSARKYRPLTFTTVVGQSSITTTLINAIKNKQLAQAFLFCGPRGVGKTTCARILAKIINCEHPTENLEACNVCPSCVSFNTSSSFNIFELDAASNNSVDDIRNLVDQVRVPPQIGKYKVYIIDEVHMLSSQAFNAFLKTLEEPPAYAKFILATTEKHKIIPTILSRCQVFDFRRINVEDISKQLAYVAANENITADPEALHVIAQKADGAMRDALSIFDQLVNSSGNHLTYDSVIENLNVLDLEFYFRITDFFLTSDIPHCLLTLNEIIENGFDGQHFLTGLGEHLRNLLVSNDEATIKLLEVSASYKNKYLEQSARCSIPFLLQALEINNKCDVNFKNSNNKRLSLEIALMQMCSIVSGNLSVAPEKIIPIKEKKVSEEEPRFSPKSAPVTTASNHPKSEQPKPVATTPEQVSKPAYIPSTGISISQKINPVKEEKPADVAEENQPAIYQPATEFTQSQLENLWDEFAASIEMESPNFFSTLTKRKPELKDNFLIELVIDNKVQEDEIIFRKADLLGFLRSKLNNSQIQLNTKIVLVQEKTKPYTPQEKFNKMAEKNPELINLKKTLDLEIDF